jgi:hypothetical protein
MRKVKLRGRTVGVAAVVAAAAIAIPVTIAAAGTDTPAPAPSALPGWQLFDVPVQGRVSLMSVTSIGPDDAWVGGALFTPSTVSPRPPASSGSPGPVPSATGVVGSAAGATNEDCNPINAASVMLHWDGRDWQRVQVPASGRINHLSASGAHDVWASTDCGPLHWDGLSWISVPMAAVPGAQQISPGWIRAVGPDDAWLAGNTIDTRTGVTHGFVQRWDGRRWEDVPLPQLGDHSSIENIDARGPDDAWAAGTSYPANDTGTEKLLLLHWNGHNWDRLPDPVAGESTKEVSAVRMVADDDVWVSGFSKTTPDGAADRHPLLLHWDGHRWATANLAVPDGRGELSDVAISGNQVMAVGDTFSPSTPTYEALVVGRTADGWQAQPSPTGHDEAGWAAATPIAGGGMWVVGAASTSAAGPYNFEPLIARRN